MHKGMTQAFPILKHPSVTEPAPILVSIPHYGTQPLPHISPEDYCEPWFETFAYGFADTFVGDIYADLHEEGATVIATPWSRIFVDVNRRRDDFQHHDGAIRSQRGVVRTHTMRDVSIFTQPLLPEALEERLQRFYDPYYGTLEDVLQRLHRRYGYAFLLDGHTGSPRRMKDYQVIIGTKHGTTCHADLVDLVSRIFTARGFSVHHNISGYAGGNIVTRYGQPQARRVHALQLEINAALLMTTSRQDFLAQVARGEIPAKAEDMIARCRACVHEVIKAVPAVLQALHA